MADLPPCLPGFSHYFLTESDGARVCQICGAVEAIRERKPLHDAIENARP